MLVLSPSLHVNRIIFDSFKIEYAFESYWEPWLIEWLRRFSMV